jgi:hypothetical protein
MKRAAIGLTAWLLTAFAGGAVARAQDAEAGGGSAQPKVKVERSASGQKIFRITEGIVVEGKIQKPNAFYVLQRSSMDYDWESLKQDFLPKILQAASRHPF